jgi:ABC-type multidrug transport system permease subunit
MTDICSNQVYAWVAASFVILLTTLIIVAQKTEDFFWTIVWVAAVSFALLGLTGVGVALLRGVC